MDIKRNYDVYFELYGKKMKAVVMVDSEDQAKEAVKEKILFHKVVRSKNAFNECMDIMSETIEIIDTINGKSKHP